MLATAQRHFVEEALGAHQDTLIDWFPGCFHWAGLCADAPAMAARLAGRPEEDDLGLEHAIRERAERVFVFSHVATLAVLACSGIHEGDPGEALEVLVDAPEDAEELYFASLVGEVLSPLEQFLAGSDQVPDLDDRGELAYALVSTAWPAVEDLLEEDGILGEEQQPVPGADETHREAVRSVLRSLALVATVLAAFRWISVGRGIDEDDP